MGKWNRKWDKKSKTKQTQESIDIDNLTEKMTKIYKKKLENPTQIEEFEDIYQRPQPSNIIEGMEDDTDTNVVKETGENVKKFIKKVPNPINMLENDLSNAFDGLSNFGDFDMDISNLFTDIGNPLDDLSGEDFLSNAGKTSKNFKNTVEEVSGSMLTLSRMLSNVFNNIGNAMLIIKTQILLFILRSNRNIKTLITRIADAITHNTATKKEIDVFQDQTQKFLAILMTWFFVYNWYYIVFFLEDEDNIRMKFDTTQLKDTSAVLYGMFGPACRAVEWMNYLIIGTGQKIKDWGVPNAMILFGMFFLFYALVQMNFHATVLSVFFNAMRGQYGPSLISLFTIAIVFGYSLFYLFGSSQTGNLELHSFVTKAVESGGSIFGIAAAGVIVFLTFLLYMYWAFAVNLPIGIFLLSAYFAAYSFSSVFIYEGFKCFDVIIGITNSIDKIIPDLNENCNPEFEWSKIPKYIYDYLCKIVNYTSMNLFEIIIVLTLLGGIGTYMKNFKLSIAGKVSSSSGLMSQTFKNLFTWLIIINILIIILICMYVYNKFKIIKQIQNSGSENFNSDQTMRSRLPNFNESPVMKTSSLKKYQEPVVVQEQNTVITNPVIKKPVITNPVIEPVVQEHVVDQDHVIKESVVDQVNN